jgi:SAM-dependent methyltransferase
MERTAVGRPLATEDCRERQPPAVPAEYRPFPDVPSRNAWQELFEVPVMVRALRLPKGGRVLEVGCGRGIALPPLARLLRPTRLVGLDVDGALLRQAADRLRRREVKAELLRGDLRELPFPGSSFDLVIDFGTCYHVARSGRALAEAERVLADGGLFVHETPVSQLLSHPARARGRRLPWPLVPTLRRYRSRLLWAARAKSSRPPRGRPTSGRRSSRLRRPNPSCRSPWTRSRPSPCPHRRSSPCPCPPRGPRTCGRSP